MIRQFYDGPNRPPLPFSNTAALAEQYRRETEQRVRQAQCLGGAFNALIEAERTMRNVQYGQRQAKLLEQALYGRPGERVERHVFPLPPEKVRRPRAWRRLMFRVALAVGALWLVDFMIHPE